MSCIKTFSLIIVCIVLYREMTARISSVLGSQIKYVSPSPLSFFIQKRKEKVPTMFILVMIMLHYFPRFSREPETTECVFQLTGKPPTTFNEFLEIHKHLLIWTPRNNMRISSWWAVPHHFNLEKRDWWDSCSEPRSDETFDNLLLVPQIDWCCHWWSYIEVKELHRYILEACS